MLRTTWRTKWKYKEYKRHEVIKHFRHLYNLYSIYGEEKIIKFRKKLFRHGQWSEKAIREAEQAAVSRSNWQDPDYIQERMEGAGLYTAMEKMDRKKRRRYSTGPFWKRENSKTGRRRTCSICSLKKPAGGFIQSKVLGIKICSSCRKRMYRIGEKARRRKKN